MIQSPARLLPLAPLPALLSLLVLGLGCRASDRPDGPGAGSAAAAPEAPASLHWPVPPPPAMASTGSVWVGLTAQLGSTGAGSPTELVSAGAAPLELQDAAGQRFTGRRLRLRWRSLPLASPLRLRRRVLGPFASFEAAEAAAHLWRQQGASPRIARPRDWEVWADAAGADPPGYPSRWVQLDHRARLEPELETGGRTWPLQGPLRIAAPAGLLWNGARHGGPFRLQGDAYGGWSLVEQVPIERYLEGVLPHEIGADAPRAALMAQAVLARTWAVRNQHRFAIDGYHLCADTQCQVYGDPAQAGKAVRDAIQRTRGQVLTWQGRPIHAVYHASNGGVSAAFEEAWPGEPLAYLRAALDGDGAFVRRLSLPLGQPAPLARLLAEPAGAYGRDHPRFRWRRLLTAEDLRRGLSGPGLAVGAPSRLEVLERGASGRVLALAIEGSGGRTVLRRDAIRRRLPQLPSTLFLLSPQGSGWLVRGGGFGHGAGLSQAGAIDLARRGWPAEKILAHYYPGTRLEPLAGVAQPVSTAPEQSP